MPIVFFAICAVVDFAMGWIKWRSVSMAILAVFFGLPLNALLFLFLKSFRKVGGDNDTPDS